MTAHIIRGNALALPLPDGSVDLVCSSPPYWSLRAYSDAGQTYAGQLGSEATPDEFIDKLIAATAEFMRVLKPTGSAFINLGDKYGPNKSLLLLPERYRIACIDRLGLIARAVIIWGKPNGLPESVTDRVRRSHEDWVMLTKSPRYFSAVDEIREETTGYHRERPMADRGDRDGSKARKMLDTCNPLGKLPGSVWTIPTQPLTVPPELGVDHFAAFPMEWPRRIIAGWSPTGICTVCGEGRRPVVLAERPGNGQMWDTSGRGVVDQVRRMHTELTARTLTGYACGCTPYTDHPGTGEPSGPYGRHADAVAVGTYENVGAGWGGKGGMGDRPRVGPWREYHFDRWTPEPTRPALVLDPFGGTGTTALVADILGRTGISVDMSADYCRLAEWRINDPGQRAAAAQVEKPEPVHPDQLDLFTDW